MLTTQCSAGVQDGRIAVIKWNANEYDAELLSLHHRFENKYLAGREPYQTKEADTLPVNERQVFSYNMDRASIAIGVSEIP